MSLYVNICNRLRTVPGFKRNLCIFRAINPLLHIVIHVASSLSLVFKFVHDLLCPIEALDFEAVSNLDFNQFGRGAYG